MSARVFHPGLVSELRHVRSSANDRNNVGLTKQSSGVLSPVARNLFGNFDSNDARMFCEDEMERNATLSMERWEFDFVNEVPCPKKGRFVWQAIPERLNTTRPSKRDREVPNDISHLYHVPEEIFKPLLEKIPAENIKFIPMTASKKQSKITGKFRIDHVYIALTFMLASVRIRRCSKRPLQFLSHNSPPLEHVTHPFE